MTENLPQRSTNQNVMLQNFYVILVLQKKKIKHCKPFKQLINIVLLKRDESLRKFSNGYSLMIWTTLLQPECISTKK